MSNYGGWSWNLKVWDVENLKIGDCDEVTLGTRLVARRAEESARTHPHGGSFCIEPINLKGTTP